MDEYRRSGVYRRSRETNISGERRTGDDRRRLLREFPILKDKVKNTDIFRGMTDEQFLSILSIGRKAEFDAGETVFAEGDYAKDVFILMDGTLHVSLNGRDINILEPVALVGEMGVFTGEPCSATVVATTVCSLLKMNELELLTLFERDISLCRQFQHGMIIDLAQKLRLSNEVITKLKG